MTAREHLDYVQERGQQRLENWRAWSRRDSDTLSYPHMSTIRRHYRPELGNVWDGEPVQDVWDAQDAWDVEQLVNGLQSMQRDIIIARYLWSWGLGRMEEHFRLARWRLRSAIHQIEIAVGRS